MTYLKSSEQRLFKKRIFAFDCETYDKNKQFSLCCLVGEGRTEKNGIRHPYRKVFFSKKDFATELKTNPIFRNSVITATNLGFDFFAVFFGNKEASKIKTILTKAGGLIFAKTYFGKDGDFTPFPNRKTHTLKSITFLDSLNFCPYGVEKLGEMIKLPKIKTPLFVKKGIKPSNKEEWDILEKYCMRDAEITLGYMRFYIKSQEELGGTFKITGAGDSMSLFKNKYLEHDYIQSSPEAMLDYFKGYYGGRVEAFKRGYVTNLEYGDFNSMYPAVMRDGAYPDVNFERCSLLDDAKFIKNFEGMSHVKIFVPKMKVQPLPYRHDNKLLFPCGTFEGWYCHNELRMAMTEGCIIMKVYKSRYFTKNCTPFKGFVTDLYAKRMKYKAEGNPMEQVIKLRMNSLYGKFGQKFLDKSNTVHKDTVTLKQLMKMKRPESSGDYITYTEDCRPAAFCIPIWAAYVTAYGRMKLYDALKKYDVYYCDTDSIMTPSMIQESKELGELKIEMHITDGQIVRGKMYDVHDEKSGKTMTKIKGLGILKAYDSRINSSQFRKAVYSGNFKFRTTRFAKIRESLRRNLTPNEIIDFDKEFSLEDDKRSWEKPFDAKELQSSEPLEIVDGNVYKQPKILIVNDLVLRAKEIEENGR